MSDEKKQDKPDKPKTDAQKFRELADKLGQTFYGAGVQKTKGVS